MPQYVFKCCNLMGGCGKEININCLMSELKDKTPKICPDCQKRTSIRQILFPPKVNIPKTLGVLADKNSNTMSSDEQASLTEKHNEYKKAKPSWTQNQDGRMVHT